MSSLSQQAYKSIKHKIVFLEMEPGAVIDDATLQQELNLGRTPIREALKQLEHEKLVTIVPRRGMFVSDINITDLYQIFELRLVIEPMATRLATKRGTESHWQAMAEALKLVPWDTAVADQLINIDQTCHTIIYQAADNRYLQDVLTTYYALSLRLWVRFLNKIGDMRAAVNEHQQIYEALRNGNADEAARLMEEHIHSFQTEIHALVLGTNAYKP